MQDNAHEDLPKLIHFLACIGHVMENSTAKRWKERQRKMKEAKTNVFAILLLVDLDVAAVLILPFQPKNSFETS